jgi:TolA-binding protein
VRITAFILFLSFAASSAQAQKTISMDPPDRDFLEGKELFDKEKYGAAMERFDAYLVSEEGTNSLRLEEASYLKALCAVELFNVDAHYLLYRFIKQHPESPLQNDARFEMGKLAYRDRHYGNCLRWFSGVEEMDLGEEERAEYFFMSGYSHFRRDQETFTGN